MRWIAQVGHVARKDVRQVWGMLGLYFATVVIGTGGVVKKIAFGPYGSATADRTVITLGMPDTLVLMIPVGLALIATFTVATLVQLDSPTRPNALWATRPLSSSAVLTSKLLLGIGVLIGMAVTGTGIALATMDTSAAAMTRILLSASLSCVECALAVLVIGALTRDLREFVGTLTTTIVGLFLLYATVGEYITFWSTPLTVALAAVSVGSGIWFVIKVYRTHERQRTTWIAAVTIAAALMFAAFNTPDPKPVMATVNPVTSIEMEPTSPDEWAAGAHLPIKLRAANVADSVRLSFEPETVLVHLANESSLQPHSRSYPTTVVNGALPWLGHAVRWINVDSTLLHWPSTFTDVPAPWDRDSIAKHGAQSVRVSGVVTVSRSRVVASVPLHENAEIASDGRRVALYGGGREGLEIVPGSEAQVYIQLSSVARPGMIPQPEQHLSERGNLQFALVNDQRGEAMLIDAAGGATEGTGAAVLPQVIITTSFDMFSTTTAFSPKGRIPTDQSWYKGARLVVVEWVVVGQYRSAAEATVR